MIGSSGFCIGYTSEDFIRDNPSIRFRQAEGILEEHGQTMDAFAEDNPSACTEGDAYIWIDSQALFDWLGY